MARSRTSRCSISQQTDSDHSRKHLHSFMVQSFGPQSEYIYWHGGVAITRRIDRPQFVNKGVDVGLTLQATADPEAALKTDESEKWAMMRTFSTAQARTTASHQNRRIPK